MIQDKASPQEQSVSVEPLLRKKSDDIKHIAARHGAYNIRVFGSVARSEATPESDIDFLIDAGPATSSRFPARLIRGLGDLMGRRVEVLTEQALNPDLRDHVLREAITL